MQSVNEADAPGDKLDVQVNTHSGIPVYVQAKPKNKLHSFVHVFAKFWPIFGRPLGKTNGYDVSSVCLCCLSCVVSFTIIIIIIIIITSHGRCCCLFWWSSSGS